jgi:hypothetical protein
MLFSAFLKIVAIHWFYGSPEWIFTRVEGLTEMTRIVILVASIVAIFNWFSREECAIVCALFFSHTIVAFSMCMAVGNDDILKIASAVLLVPMAFIVHKTFAIDPVDRGIIINEQELIMQNYMP